MHYPAIRLLAVFVGLVARAIDDKYRRYNHRKKGSRLASLFTIQ